jgi:hypothetical protein
MKRQSRKADPERLRELFIYYPEAGALKWRIQNSCRIRPGDEAGYLDVNEYVVVGVDGDHLFAHKICWAIYYGEWPDFPVAFKDGDRHNLAIDNLEKLEERFIRQRGTNIHKQPRLSSTGYRGVQERRKSGRYFARINGKYLGTFSTAAEAARAYDREAVKVFGPSAILNNP